MGQESQSTDSLYDFLYVDTERASRIIAQLYAPGVVTSIKNISSEGEKSVKQGGVDLKVAKGGLSVEDAITQTQEKLFDSSWSLPINLLDKLSESQLIKKGIEGQNLGQLVLIEGQISFFDISFFQRSIPFISKMFLNQHNDAKKGKKISADNIPLADGLTFGMVKDLLDIIPDGIQIDFIDENGNNIWMTINRENFTINPDDMALKYGDIIPGVWYALGLVDALPNHLYKDYTPAEFPSNDMKSGLKLMLSGLQDAVGRSSEAYSVTPIVLFRKIQ